MQLLLTPSCSLLPAPLPARMVRAGRSLASSTPTTPQLPPAFWLRVPLPLPWVRLPALLLRRRRFPLAICSSSSRCRAPPSTTATPAPTATAFQVILARVRPTLAIQGFSSSLRPQMRPLFPLLAAPCSLQAPARPGGCSTLTLTHTQLLRRHWARLLPRPGQTESRHSHLPLPCLRASYPARC